MLVFGKCRVRKSGKLMFTLSPFVTRQSSTWHGVLMVCSALKILEMPVHAECTIVTGQAIALIHHPPRITIHSVQDGHEEHSPPLVHKLSESARLTGVWWFKNEKQVEVDSIPDIFKRGSDIVCLRNDPEKTDADYCFCESQDPPIPSSSTYLYWIRFQILREHCRLFLLLLLYTIVPTGTTGRLSCSPFRIPPQCLNSPTYPRLSLLGQHCRRTFYRRLFNQLGLLGNRTLVDLKVQANPTTQQ